jgi:hypothetical protein
MGDVAAEGDGRRGSASSDTDGDDGTGEDVDDRIASPRAAVTVAPTTSDPATRIAGVRRVVRGAGLRWVMRPSQQTVVLPARIRISRCRRYPPAH